ncbi:MAG: hypothetical protein AMR96_07125 [Candidatus Adiutrix intracellularis]|jgi:thiol:disulfide interchange protein DsbA|nr:MAG: hypothetical protein AMR96_07125 [Candidatus Adiutrix intracellularis]MDR2827701.1 thiol:disulfide interchange protein DsbA/DsbL [Candidatus Adiutrix intracellularis]
MRSFLIMLVLVVLFLVVPVAQAQNNEVKSGGSANFQVDREYVELPSPPVLYEPEDGRVEVLSFFWYGCPHCYIVDFEVAAWAAQLPSDVRFVWLPVKFKAPVDFHARIFLTLEALGQGRETDRKVFAIFQDQGHFINTPAELPGLARDLKIDPALFVQTFNSSVIQAKMEILEKLMNVYNLPGVPSMVIDGKYRFDIGMTHGPARYIKLADLLIARERALRAEKTPDF